MLVDCMSYDKTMSAGDWRIAFTRSLNRLSWNTEFQQAGPSSPVVPGTAPPCSAGSKGSQDSKSQATARSCQG